MRNRKKQAKYFYMFISPWLIGFFLLTVIPLGYSIYLSLTKYTGYKAPKFIGFQNYLDMFFHMPLLFLIIHDFFH